MTVAPGEILTYTGKYVTPLDLQPEQVDISDIAHALSMQCRFSGHVRHFYSVAQHSVLCVDYLKNRGASIDVQRQALLHDAAEAYLQDMARPLKELEEFGFSYREAEHLAMRSISKVFEIKHPHESAVKEADLALLALERQELMPALGHWGILDGVSVPNDLEIRSWPPEMAKTFFMREFERLFLTNHQEDTMAGDAGPQPGDGMISLDDFLAGRWDRVVPYVPGQGMDDVIAELPMEELEAAARMSQEERFMAAVDQGIIEEVRPIEAFRLEEVFPIDEIGPTQPWIEEALRAAQEAEERFAAGEVDQGIEILHATDPEAGLGTKPTNPKDAVGSDKLPMHLWPATATVYGSLGLLEGMLKYGRANWRAAGVRASIYHDALARHMAAWFEGEDIDPDSGLPHLAHALACLAILVDALENDMLVDDRQYRGGEFRAVVGGATPEVARLKAKYAEMTPKHYTIADSAE